MKICITCKKDKETQDFPPNRNNTDGLNDKCRECYNSYMRDWYSKNKEKHKARVAQGKKDNPLRDRAARYGLSVEELERLLLVNGGFCAICSENKIEAIDHCHKTNKVRGGLCKNCNLAIGLLGESQDNLRNAIDYLAGVSPHAYNMLKG